MNDTNGKIAWSAWLPTNRKEDAQTGLGLDLDPEQTSRNSELAPEDDSSMWEKGRWVLENSWHKIEDFGCMSVRNDKYVFLFVD